MRYATVFINEERARRLGLEEDDVDDVVETGVDFGKKVFALKGGFPVKIFSL